VSVFRKKRQNDDDVELDDDVETADEADLTDEAAGDADERRAPAARPGGPFDIGEVDDPAAGGRVDLGGLWLPGRPGLEVRIEADQETAEVVAVSLVLGEGALQVQPFAAPRSEGIWDDVRAEIAESLNAERRSSAKETDGPFGTELHGSLPADDGKGTVPVRFIGVDGPRWFLRALLAGPVATDDAKSSVFEDALRGVVVVRGTDPLPVREPVPLQLPGDLELPSPE
jgi:hypothetical protein